MNLADALPLSRGARSLPVHRLRGGQRSDTHDWVADEVPVALEFNGISHAVMLATPLDLADFALGFALSEGILEGRHELYGVDEVPSPAGITLQLDVAAAAFLRLRARRRSLAGRTGCGLCGTESLEHVARDLPALPDAEPLQHRAVVQAMQQMRSLQTLQNTTGAVHAAAWCSGDGQVQLIREDVGRHNALDKLVGALASAGIEARTGFIAVTSRASFEMVQKTAAVGVALLAAISAPTTLAIATAQQARLALAGFVRGDDLVVYTHPERLLIE